MTRFVINAFSIFTFSMGHWRDTDMQIMGECGNTLE